MIAMNVYLTLVAHFAIVVNDETRALPLNNCINRFVLAVGIDAPSCN